MIERMCKNCGNTFPQYNSTQTLCSKCSFNKYQNQGRKPIKKVGKITKKWFETRKEWIKQNPGNNGWHCYLCGKLLDINTLTLDHKLSRSRHPELRFELSNLAPACARCNYEKGSKNFISTL